MGALAGQPADWRPALSGTQVFLAAARTRPETGQMLTRRANGKREGKVVRC